MPSVRAATNESRPNDPIERRGPMSDIREPAPPEGDMPVALASSPDAVLATTATPSPRTRSWRYHFWILAAALGVLSLAAVFQVASRDAAVVSLPWFGDTPEFCTWKRMFGLSCPGCGLTRSITSIVHGQWAAAWAFNPAGWLFFAVCLYQIPFRSVQLWRLSRRLPEIRYSARTVNVVVWTLLAALFTQWIWRMVVAA